jgi:ABC-type dipeptide/oligopeptide/nickel transport system permease subunit
VYGPGTAIFLTVLCLDLVGDGRRDALDPRINRFG